MVERLAFMSGKSVPALLAVLMALAAGLFPIGHPARAVGQAETSGRLSYVLFRQGSASSTMSGSTEDLRRAKAVRAGGEGLLYVREGDGAYVIRDAGILRRAQAIFEPQEAVGAKQAELGSQQAVLGHRQAALGAEQGRLGARQAGATPRQQETLANQQEALARRQDVLARQQDALGARQDVMGREQDRLAREADVKFRALLADALQRGLAQRVR